MKATDALQDVSAALAAIGDPVRLRMLRVLEREELAVGEIARVLQLPQSTVSRRLKLLADHGWVQRRAAKTATLYRCVPDDLPAHLRGMWLGVRESTDGAAELAGDDRRLRAVLADRTPSSAAFFGRVGAAWDDVSRELFGERYAGEALASLLPPRLRAIDIGCGTGVFTAMLAPVAAEVVAIDREPAMLEAARRRVGSHARVRFERSDAASLPFADGSFDLAVLGLVLHHAEEPWRLLGEAGRVLGGGGRLLVVDMLPHGREEFRLEMGHAWLGFDADTLSGWLSGCGLRLDAHRPLPSTPGVRGPDVFAATASKVRRGAGADDRDPGGHGS